MAQEIKESSTTGTNTPTEGGASPQSVGIISSNSSEEADDLVVARLPTREGWATPLTLYNQCWLRSYTLAKLMAVRENFKPRADDIILATHPKSGTNWLKALAFTIFNRSRYSILSDDHPLLTTHPQMAVPIPSTSLL